MRAIGELARAGSRRLRWCSPSATPARSPPAESAPRWRRCTGRTRPGRRCTGHCRRDPAPCCRGSAHRLGAEPAGRVPVYADGAIAAAFAGKGTSTCVIVGADRIAANGDIANKIGTYPLALPAKAHDVPFYVAAPQLDVRSGDAQWRRHPDRGARRGRESPCWREAPDRAGGVAVWNPAFDVTPAELGAHRDHRESSPPGLLSRPWTEPRSSRSTRVRRVHRTRHASGRSGARSRISRVHPVLPRARLGRARSARGAAPGIARGDAEAWRRRRRGRRRWGSPISARRSCCGTGAASIRCARAIVWQDRRTSARCRELQRRRARAVLRGRTGLVADPYFSATKLEWLLRDPELRAAAEERGASPRGRSKAGWWRGSPAGGFTRAITPTRAARSSTISPRATWHDELLAFLGVPREVLPEHHAFLGRAGRHRRHTWGSRLPIAGPRGGPAVGAVRAGLLHRRGWRRTPTAPARSCWCTRAAACRSRPRGVLGDGGVRSAWRAGLRDRRERVHRGRRGPVAARWSPDHRERARERALAEASGHGGSGVRARIRRPGHAALGGGGAWDDLRHHPRQPRGRTWRVRRWRRSHSAAPTCCTP